jgi:tetratricopeptide (TPR) repeat protein
MEASRGGGGMPAPLRWLMRVPITLPQVVAVVVLAILGSHNSGFAATSWYPAALFLAALLAVCLVAVPRRSAAPRAVWVAVGAFAGFTAWSYLSILWADDQGAAWTGSNRTLLFLVCFALFALWRQRGGHAALVLGLWTAWLIGLAAATLIRVDTAADLDPLFIGDRLSAVSGYPNATAAALLMGFFPAVVLAGRRELPWWLRGLFAGGAVVCFDVALLAQSRGALYSLPIVLALTFILVPGRLRSLAVLAGVGVGLALTVPEILSDLDAFSARRAPAALDGLGQIVAIAAAATAVIVAIGAAVDARTEVPAATAAKLRRRVGTVVLVLVAAGLIGTVAVAGDPGGRISRAWDSFKGGYQSEGSGSRLASGLGSNRYDFYRVALNQFTAAPIAGAGAENFLEDYLVARRSDETPRYPHSVELRTLGQLGLVGAALLLALLIAAGVGLWSALRQTDQLAGAVAGAATIVFAYWFVHGSFDWFWEYAGLGGPAFAMLGLACGLVPRAGDRPEARPFLKGPAALLLALPVAAVVAYTFVAPWLSERWAGEASRTWRSDPAQALDLVDRAAAANPLSSRPYLVGGIILVRIDDLPRARAEFEKAVQRQPRSVYAALELGAIASEFGQRQAAIAWLTRAVQASPTDPVARAALRRVSRGDRVTPAEINDRIARRTRGLVR